MILAIETSAGQCAVALVGDGTEICSVEAMDRGHAERLFPLIDATLAKAGAAPSDLSRVAVCTGPGSFTGLRLGIAAARGLALSLDIPAIGVTRFEALAMAANEAPAQVIVPARGGTVYVQPFGPDRRPTGEAYIAERKDLGDVDIHAEQQVDPVILARVAGQKPVGAPPAAFYMRGPDAAVPTEAPPRILD